MAGQIYRECHQSFNPNGGISTKEVWRGYSQNYTPTDLPPNTFRIFELYVFGSGWVIVDRPIWAVSLGTTNPQQEEME
jgi:hypothetical protein